MKISVIIPFYGDRLDALEKCIRSIEFDAEIIVIDDGTHNILLEKFLNYYDCKMITHKENMGILQSRIDGIKASTCEYVTFIDSDDYYNDNCTEMIKVIEENPGKDLYSFITNHSISREGDLNVISEYYKFVTQCRDKISPYVHNKVYSKELLVRVLSHFKFWGYDTKNISMGEDTLINIIALNLTTSIYHKNASYYTKSESGVSKALPRYADSERIIESYNSTLNFRIAMNKLSNSTEVFIQNLNPKLIKFISLKISIGRIVRCMGDYDDEGSYRAALMALSDFGPELIRDYLKWFYSSYGDIGDYSKPGMIIQFEHTLKRYFTNFSEDLELDEGLEDFEDEDDYDDYDDYEEDDYDDYDPFYFTH